MKLIVAVDKNFGIGYKGGLLFSIPEDMKYFRETTLNKVVVMGRATYESLPFKPLKNRVNIVLSADMSYSPAGATVCRSAADVFKEIKKYPPGDVYIIGGERVYREFLPYCDTALITKVRSAREADSFFPDIDKLDCWEKVKESEVKSFEGLEFTFTEYGNNNTKAI